MRDARKAPALSNVYRFRKRARYPRRIGAAVALKLGGSSKKFRFEPKTKRRKKAIEAWTKQESDATCTPVFPSTPGPRARPQEPRNTHVETRGKGLKKKTVRASPSPFFVQLAAFRGAARRRQEYFGKQLHVRRGAFCTFAVNRIQQDPPELSRNICAFHVL